MTKEQWLIVRKKEEIPMEVWFEYYTEKGGILKNIAEFEHYFTQMLTMRQIIIVNGQHKELGFGSAVRRIIKYYNEKFGV